MGFCEFVCLWRYGWWIENSRMFTTKFLLFCKHFWWFHCKIFLNQQNLQSGEIHLKIQSRNNKKGEKFVDLMGWKQDFWWNGQLMRFVRVEISPFLIKNHSQVAKGLDWVWIFYERIELIEKRAKSLIFSENFRFISIPASHSFLFYFITCDTRSPDDDEVDSIHFLITFQGWIAKIEIFLSLEEFEGHLRWAPWQSSITNFFTHIFITSLELVSTVNKNSKLTFIVERKKSRSWW